MRIRRSLFAISGIFIGLVIIAVLFLTGYVFSLFSLVDSQEITGDPSIPESDLVGPVETTTEPSGTTDATGGSDPTTTEPSQETTIPTTVPTLSNLPILSDKQVYNILLIGTDNRGDEINGRSDAMIILSINKRTQKIHLVSLMRGMYVKIEGHGWSMLNNAFSWGGSRRLLLTIEENLRVRISDYAMVDFSTFKQAIDMAGGVDIELTAAEISQMELSYPEAGLVEGVNHLDGALALAYARIRHIDSDFRRTARQRAIIESLFRKMSQMNLGDLDALLRQILPLVKTNISSGTMAELLLNSLSYANYPISEKMLPVNGSFETIIVRGMQMIRYDIKENVLALQDFLYND